MAILNEKQRKLAMSVTVTSLKDEPNDESERARFSFGFTSANPQAVKMATRLMRALPSHLAQWDRSRRVWVVRTELGPLINSYLPLGEFAVQRVKADRLATVRANFTQG